MSEFQPLKHEEQKHYSAQSNEVYQIEYVDRVPQLMVCPKCGHKAMTQTEYKAGNCTYLTCGLCCLFGCCLGCCLIPFCVNDLKDVHHKCSACKKFITKAGFSTKTS
jgi:hypothetical protein